MTLSHSSCRNARNVVGVMAILAAGLDFADGPSVQIERDRECLALAAFAEARNQGHIGMAAVIRVVINRATDPLHRWPRSLCGVVHEPGQFVGVEKWRDPSRAELSDAISWRRSLALADAMLAGTGPALGACAVATSFDKSGRAAGLVPVCRLGAHVFYVEPQIDIVGIP